MCLWMMDRYTKLECKPSLEVLHVVVKEDKREGKGKWESKVADKLTEAERQA